MIMALCLRRAVPQHSLQLTSTFIHRRPIVIPQLQPPRVCVLVSCVLVQAVVSFFYSQSLPITFNAPLFYLRVR